MNIDRSIYRGTAVFLASVIAAVAQNPPAPLAANVIERIEFAGAGQVPVDTLKALVTTKAGDVYDEDAMHRGFTALWNTGRFDDIQVKTDKGERGGVVVRFVLTDRTRGLPALAANVIERIEFQGMSRVPEETMRAAVLAKAGDVYDEAEMRRNFTSLWNTKQFEDIQLKTEKGERGGVVVRFVVTERP